MATITDPKSWPVDNQEVRMRKGPLIKVQIGPGQYRKMYQADAEAAGLLKAKPQVQNKMQAPAQNKAPKLAQPVEEAPPAADFTTIPGVGPATARALTAHGITTFEQLRHINSPDFLPPKAVQAIADWLNSQADNG
jgi:predicted flap endonuclease-1-like 5' DNA nuclease